MAMPPIPSQSPNSPAATAKSERWPIASSTVVPRMLSAKIPTTNANAASPSPHRTVPAGAWGSGSGVTGAEVREALRFLARQRLSDNRFGAKNRWDPAAADDRVQRHFSVCAPCPAPTRENERQADQDAYWAGRLITLARRSSQAQPTGTLRPSAWAVH